MVLLVSASVQSAQRPHPLGAGRLHRLVAAAVEFIGPVADELRQPAMLFADFGLHGRRLS
jgi:hypothetical protein